MNVVASSSEQAVEHSGFARRIIPIDLLIACIRANLPEKDWKCRVVLSLVSQNLVVFFATKAEEEATRSITNST